MTDLRSFFNILLLSISLATVILTIISFLVFKVRYALKNQFNSNLFNLKGSYFNRYAPHLEKKNKDSQEKFEKEVANRKLSPQMKIGLSFGSVFVFIVFALSAENFLVHRKKINQKITSAKEYKDLIKQGLLKTYSFNPNIKKDQFDENISPLNSNQYQYLLGQINHDRKIYLIVSMRNAKLKNSKHQQALDRWREFFKRTGIKHEETTLAKIDGGNLYILPQVELLTSSEATQIQKLKEAIGLIVTGTPRVDSDKDHTAFLSRLFNTKVAFRENSDHYLPSQFLGKNGLPPGLTLDWYPLANDAYLAIDNPTQSLARKVSINGSKPKSGIEFQDYTSPTDLHSWMSLEPKTFDEDQKANQFYADFYIINKLAQTLKRPIVDIAPWKKFSYKAALSFNLLTREHPERVKDYVDLFNGKTTSASFFVNGRNLDKGRDHFYRYQNFEFALNGGYEELAKDKKLRDLYLGVEDSRLGLEEIAHSPVSGVYVPSAFHGRHGYSAIYQNQMDYILGKNSGQRFAPYFLGSKQVSYYGQPLRDANDIWEEKFVVNQADFKAAFNQDLAWIEGAYGSHQFALDLDSKNHEEQKNFLQEFLASKNRNSYWIDQTRKIVSWWKKRSQVAITYENGVVSLVNQGNEPIKDFEVVLHHPNSLNSRCRYREFASEMKKDKIVFNIEELSPAQKVHLCR